MYLIDRLSAWSELDPIVTLGPPQYVRADRRMRILQVTYNDPQGGRTDLSGSQTHAEQFELLTDQSGRPLFHDYVMFGILNGVIQRGCEARNWPWSISQDALGIYHATVDQVTAEAASCSFQALIDAYLQRLQREQLLSERDGPAVQTASP